MIGPRGVPATFGGIERHVEELGARLVERGHEVTVYGRSNYLEAPIEEHRGMRVKSLPTVDSKHLDAIVHSGVVDEAAIRDAFDVMHYHAIGPGVMAALPRFASPAKVVLTVHGLDDERAKWGRGAPDGAAHRGLDVRAGSPTRRSWSPTTWPATTVSATAGTPATSPTGWTPRDRLPAARSPERWA